MLKELAKQEQTLGKPPPPTPLLGPSLEKVPPTQQPLVKKLAKQEQSLGQPPPHFHPS